MSHRLGAPTAEACPEPAHATGATPVVRHDERADRRAVNRAVGVSALGLFVTGALELVIALLTGSVSLLADAFHNLSDVSTSLVVFVGFRVSRRLPSRRYPYGYDRAEDLAGLGVALVIWSSAAFAVAESVRKLTEHGTTSHVGAGIAAAVLGIVGNQVVARYKLRVGHRVQSATLVSDAQHSWLDALSSAGALAGLIAVAAGWRYGDPIAGLAVALFICHVGWEVTHDLVSRLMDGIDPDLLHTAEHAAADVPGVRHAHARGRWAGRQLNIEVEGWVEADLTLAEAERLGRQVEQVLVDRVPEVRRVTWLPRAMPAPHPQK